MSTIGIKVRHGMVLQVEVFSGEALVAARDWAKDCSWVENEDEIDEMTPEQITRGVQRHYDGGYRQFLVDSCLTADGMELSSDEITRLYGA